MQRIVFERVTNALQCKHRPASQPFLAAFVSVFADRLFILVWRFAVETRCRRRRRGWWVMRVRRGRRSKDHRVEGRRGAGRSPGAERVPAVQVVAVSEARRCCRDWGWMAWAARRGQGRPSAAVDVIRGRSEAALPRRRPRYVGGCGSLRRRSESLAVRRHGAPATARESPTRTSPGSLAWSGGSSSPPSASPPAARDKPTIN